MVNSDKFQKIFKDIDEKQNRQIIGINKYQDLQDFIGFDVAVNKSQANDRVDQSGTRSIHSEKSIKTQKNIDSTTGAHPSLDYVHQPFRGAMSPQKKSVSNLLRDNMTRTPLKKKQTININLDTMCVLTGMTNS